MCSLNSKETIAGRCFFRITPSKTPLPGCVRVCNFVYCAWVV